MASSPHLNVEALHQLGLNAGWVSNVQSSKLPLSWSATMVDRRLGVQREDHILHVTGVVDDDLFLNHYKVLAEEYFVTTTASKEEEKGQMFVAEGQALQTAQVPLRQFHDVLESVDEQLSC